MSGEFRIELYCEPFVLLFKLAIKTKSQLSATPYQFGALGLAGYCERGVCRLDDVDKLLLVDVENHEGSFF